MLCCTSSDAPAAPAACTHVSGCARTAASTARSDVSCCACSGATAAPMAHARLQLCQISGVRDMLVTPPIAAASTPARCTTRTTTVHTSCCRTRVASCACAASACVRVCVRACVRACVCTFVCAFARASVHACSGGGGGGGGGRGYCGGRGGCTYASSDTPCGRVDKRCVDALFYPKPMCDGNGTCVSLAAIPCLGGYACSADERRCRTDCTSITVTPPHCQSMHYCNVAASACTPKRGEGGPCPDGRRPARCVRQRPLRSRRVLRPAVQRSAVPVLRPHVACVLALWTRAVRSFPSHACPCACMHGCVRACVCVCVRVRVRVRELVYVCRDARTCA